MTAKNLQLTRDQKRAVLAYDVVENIRDNSKFDNFATLINNIGAQIIRSGLAATLAFAERYHDQDAADSFKDLLATHMRQLKIYGLEQSQQKSIAADIRKLPVREYMLVTRELLKLTVWLKRAIQARKIAER